MLIQSPRLHFAMIITTNPSVESYEKNVVETTAMPRARLKSLDFNIFNKILAAVVEVCNSVWLLPRPCSMHKKIQVEHWWHAIYANRVESGDKFAEISMARVAFPDFGI